MQHILYITDAKKLSVQNESFLIMQEELIEKRMHPNDIAAIIVESLYCIITTPAMLLANDTAIPIILCNHQHQPQIYCLDLFRHHQLLDILNQQISWIDANKYSAWKMIIHAKLSHQVKLLAIHNCSQTAISQVTEYINKIELLSTNSEEINTIESISARIYFNALFGEHFKRFNEDNINHALNYGYAIIRSIILNNIVARGLHPSLGIWHHSVRNRFNLADDLIEPIRPLIDYVVYNIYLVDHNTVFDKEQRTVLLGVINYPVLLNGTPYTLKYAIECYIQSRRFNFEMHNG